MKSRDEMDDIITPKYDDELKTWIGFKFKMGAFIVINANKVRIGKCDPETKEVIEWSEIE
jgi:hypothetical protein